MKSAASQLNIGLLGYNGRSKHDLLVNVILDHCYFLSSESLEVAEVEAEEFVGNEATLLLHMSAEHLAERSLQQVSRGVVLADVVTAVVVDGSHEHGTHRRFVGRTLLHLAAKRYCVF